MIKGGFASIGETNNAREVYASQASGITMVGKRKRPEDEMIVSFSKCKMEHVTCPRDDALVITMEIDGYNVKRVMIDSDSSTNVIFFYALKNMRKSEKDLKKVNFHLMGFASITTYPVGAITLQVFLSEC